MKNENLFQKVKNFLEGYAGNSTALFYATENTKILEDLNIGNNMKDDLMVDLRKVFNLNKFTGMEIVKTQTIADMINLIQNKSIKD